MNFWGKILIIGLACVGIAWFAYGSFRESARIRELAALPPCSLAAEYMEWRLAYEEANSAAEATGSAAATFVDQSELFEKAVRRAQDGSSSALLQELESLTTMDSASWVRGGGDIDDFVQIMLAECPDEVRALISGSER